MIAYCSSHISFSRKTKEEIPKPFHNERAKIRGRILFKRRGIMQSEVLNKVRCHGKSWGSHGVAYALSEIKKWPTRQIRLTTTGRLNPPEPQRHDFRSQCRSTRYHILVSCFRFRRLLMFPFSSRVSRV